MSGLWLLPLHSGLAGFDWLTQILVIAIIGGVWLLAAGAIERRAARRGPAELSAGPSAGNAGPSTGLKPPR